MGKSPAFQLYAADFYMDTAGWTATEVGAYFRLLLHEWVNGPLPNHMPELARIAGISDVRTLHKMWLATLGKKFTVTDGNLLVNKRLEEEREKQVKRRELQSEKGKSGACKRWNKPIADAIAQAQPNDSFSSSSSLTTTKEKKIKEKKIVLTDEEWLQSLTANPIYQGIDVKAVYGKMQVWCETNHKTPTRRRFINWLNRTDKPMGGNNGPNTNRSNYRAENPGAWRRPGQPSELPAEISAILDGVNARARIAAAKAGGGS